MKWQGNQLEDVCLDNTGRRHFVPEIPLPTLNFPSDHAIVSSLLLLPKVDSSTGKIICRPRYQPPIIPTPLFRPSCAEIESENQGEHSSVADVNVHVSNSRRASRTLYDYWGFAEKPPGSESLLPMHETYSCFHRRKCIAPKIIYAQGDSMSVMEDEISEICENFFVQAVTNPRGEDLDTRNLILSKAADRSIWIMYTSRPVSLILSLTWFQIAFLLFGISMIVDGAVNIWNIESMSERVGQYFRSVSPNGANISASLLLLQDGCDIGIKPIWENRNHYNVFAFSPPQRYNGWRLTGEVPGEPALANSITIRLQASPDQTEWENVPLPPWILKSSTFKIHRVHTNNTDVLQNIDLRPPLDWIVLNCVCRLGLGFAVFLSCILGRLRETRSGALTISFAWLLYGLVYIAELIYCVSEEAESSLTFIYFLYAICYITTSCTLFYERYQVDFLLIETGMFLCTRNLDFSIHFQESELSQIDHYLWILSDSLLLVLSAVLIIARTFTRHWILEQSVRKDKEKFDACWDSIITDENANLLLTRIREKLNDLSKSLETGVLRQRHKAQCIDYAFTRLESIFGEPVAKILHFLAPTGPKNRVFKPHITSLDQLFNQAVCIDCFLKMKVKQLALVSNGLVLVSVNENESNKYKYIRLDEILATSCLSQNIRWSPLKGTQRALEKLLRVYDCDVSRLLDCCRQRIIFENLDDILKCLVAMEEDPEIEIVRIKNMMDVNYDSRFTAGFRFFHLFCVDYLAIRFPKMHMLSNY